MGERYPKHRLAFNRSIHVEARSESLSSDGGALLLREGLEQLGAIEAITRDLEDPRDPRYVRHSLAKLLLSQVLLLAQGWKAQANADRLFDDPVLASAHSDRRGMQASEDWLPSQSSFSRTLDILSRPGNAQKVETAPMRLAGLRMRAMDKKGRKPKVLTIDVDGLPLQAHGEQPGVAYNGHVKAPIHYPLIASCGETGDMLAARLREGNASPAAEAPDWIPQVVAEAESYLCDNARVRVDAGFTDGKTLDALEERGIEFMGRLRENPRLQRMAQPYLEPGPGRPPKKPREHVIEATYQADSWARERRLLMVVTKRPDRLFNDVFYLVTNIPKERCSGESVLALYRKRGQAESCMGELKSSFGTSLPATSRLTSSDAQAFARNQALLILRMLAYQSVHLIRRLLEQHTGWGWQLRPVREQVLKVGTHVLRHARRLIMIPSPSVLSFWDPLLYRLGRLSPTPG